MDSTIRLLSSKAKTRFNVEMINFKSIFWRLKYSVYKVGRVMKARKSEIPPKKTMEKSTEGN